MITSVTYPCYTTTKGQDCLLISRQVTLFHPVFPLVQKHKVCTKQKTKQLCFHHMDRQRKSKCHRPCSHCLHILPHVQLETVNSKRQSRMLWTEVRHGDSSKHSSRDVPGGTVVKNPPANAGDTGSSPGPERSHMP